MPLPKHTPKRKQSAARLERYHARRAAERYFGKRAVKGKQIHHRNGNKSDNRKRNLKPIKNNEHGRLHGRGIKGNVLRDLKFSIRKKLNLI